MCIACSVQGMERYENKVAEVEEIRERYEGKGYTDNQKSY